MPIPIPGIPEVNPKDDLNNATEPKSKAIGVIIPPPEIRKIADKTAEYVAKNGSAFEEIVFKSEASNPKFSFLKPNDPYRAYFEEKVIEFAKGGAPEREEPRPEPTVAPIAQKKDIRKEIRRDIKPPAADKFTVQPNTSITVLDMDVIKLTAQFVAKKGQKFLIALTEREKQNPQFDFLKPTHQLFSFFMNLLDAYSKCINPSKSDVMRLQQYAEDRMAVLNAAGERFEFDQQQNQLKKTKDDREDEERTQMAQIDWNEFVVVETIDLFDDEALPAPSTFTKPEAKPIEADAFRTQPPVNMTSALPQAQPFQKPAEAAPAGSDIKVKRDYVRPSAQGDSLMNKCPNCGQYIPVSEFNEHLRIEMLDPKYKEIKADVHARAQNTTMSSGEDIAQNLKNLARNMPSVLGSVDSRRDDELRGGPAPKLIWDGQSGSMTRTTANQAMIAQQQKKNYEEQMRVIQDIDLGDMRRTGGGGMPTMQPGIGAQNVSRTPAGPFLPQDMARGLAKPPHEKQDIGGHEGTKRVRTEEAGLLPEAMWLEMNSGNITLNISVPNLEEEGIQSRLLQVQFDPRTTIQGVKEQLSGMLGGLPAAKMRLKTNNLSVLKDEGTLAYYNLLNGTVMDLGLKERGGRNH